MKRIVQFFTSSIYRRILSSFATVIVLVLGMTAAGYLQLSQVRGSAERAVPNAQQMGLVQDFALEFDEKANDVPPLDGKPAKTNRGEVFQLGRHRLSRSPGLCL